MMDRRVLVLFKEGTFEPSSPVQHATELAKVLEEKAFDRSVLFLYSDGGPDHRLRYLSQVIIDSLVLEAQP